MLATPTENKIRNAAVLIRSLDSEAAAAVFARLSADEARALRAAVRDLGDVSDDEHENVAQALRDTETTTAPAVGGVELSLGTSDHYQPPTPATVSEPDDLTSALNAADAETLVPFLRNEQPLTVAVVLSCLKPDRAAEVLAALPTESRPLVLDRLADLGEADPQSLEVLTSGLRDWIGQQQLRRQRRQKGIGAIEAILAATTEQDRSKLLTATADRSWTNELPRQYRASIDADNVIPNVDQTGELVSNPVELSAEPTVSQVAAPEAAVLPAAESPPVQQELPPLLIQFEQLDRLPTVAIAQVLRHTPAEHWMLALATGSKSLLKKITTALPRKQATSLHQRIRNLGPIRLRDIEAAQQSMAHTASELLRRGWITVTAPQK